MEAQTVSKTPSLDPREHYTKELPEEIFAKHITKQTPGVMSTQQARSLASHKGVCGTAAQSFIKGFWSSKLLFAVCITMKRNPQTLYLQVLCPMNVPGHIQFKHHVVGNNQVLVFARAASLCLSDFCTQNSRADIFK